MITPAANSREINELLARYGVKFGIYKNGSFHEQHFRFDAIPRIIAASDFSEIEKGLIRRVNALNMLQRDVYSDKKIIADGVIPKDFVYSSTRFLQQCDEVSPPKEFTATFRE